MGIFAHVLCYCFYFYFCSCVSSETSQQPPAFLAPETGFVEDHFSTDQVEGGRFQDDSSVLHLMCTLFLLILYQLHLRSSGIRFQKLGTTAKYVSMGCGKSNNYHSSCHSKGNRGIHVLGNFLPKEF